MKKIAKTMKLQGNEYAKVTDRIKEFRAACPNGLVETSYTITDEQIVFKARVLKDKADASSAEGTGHAMGTNKGTKAFEKLETIAVGRALAMLGYAADGEIATSEEMEEFQEYQRLQKEHLISEMKERLDETKTLDELKTAWSSVPAEVKDDLAGYKDELKKKYEN